MVLENKSTVRFPNTLVRGSLSCSHWVGLRVGFPGETMTGTTRVFSSRAAERLDSLALTFSSDKTRLIRFGRGRRTTAISRAWLAANVPTPAPRWSLG